MRNVKNQLMTALLCGIAAMFFGSCSDSAPAEKKAETAKADTPPKPKWNDPQKGKIFSKVNYVQIPLTAYENHIFGEVKSVTYKDYKVSEKDGAKTLDDSGYNVYDKAGHLIDQNEFDNAGKPKWKCVYKYDDKNMATQWDIKVFRSKTNSQVTFKYDDKGRKIEQNEAAANKEESRRLVYKYDDNGNEIEEAEYYGDKKKPWITTYKYDSKGNQIEYAHIDETGRILSKMTGEYDSRGNKISSISYTSDTAVQGKWTATVDEIGRITEYVYYRKYEKFGSVKLKYDEWDNVTEYIAYNANGSMDTTGRSYYTEYEYDSKGNPTKETSYSMKNGKKVMTDVAEKTYEYY